MPRRFAINLSFRWKLALFSERLCLRAFVCVCVNSRALLCVCVCVCKCKSDEGATKVVEIFRRINLTLFYFFRKKNLLNFTRAFRNLKKLVKSRSNDKVAKK